MLLLVQNMWLHFFILELIRLIVSGAMQAIVI